MLLVVFGAGASYDSSPSIRPPDPNGIPIPNTPWEEFRPPLASQLFSDRENFEKVAAQFPDCQPIIPFLQHVPENRTVEEVLEGLQGEAKENPRRHSQLAAIRHYLHFIISECEHHWKGFHRGVTNFHTLLDEIEDWRSRVKQQVSLVTFNYDTMLENALPAVGVNISKLGDYISHDYKLIKVHGSVNWGRAVYNAHVREDANAWSAAKALIDAASHLRLHPKYEIMSERPIAKTNDSLLIPALAIPIVTKQEYECPKEHLQVLTECLPKVRKMLVVGWRANERHFLHLLGETVKQPIEVMIVSGSTADATQTTDNLSRARLSVIDGYKCSVEGFSDFVVKRTVRRFLGI